MLVRAAVTFALSRIPEWVDEVLLLGGHSAENMAQIAQNVRPDAPVICEIQILDLSSIRLYTAFPSPTHTG